ncbi:hypothetical protein WJX84_007082 [Apatococcus fuscideae]|uniref:Uncharacterized protein n=1 Tax=Apatococcus fuscideae TaxID=2026836 RepID=A0AAW1T404_9CHLO
MASGFIAAPPTRSSRQEVSKPAGRFQSSPRPLRRPLCCSRWRKAPTSLAVFATALIIFVRPLLKRLEKLAEAAEAASRSFEQSSNQFEKTCAMAQLDLPPVMESIEKASKEFEELGLHLRIMTGGKRKPAAPKPPAPPSEKSGDGKADEKAAKAALVSTSKPAPLPARNSFQRVAQDVVTLTHALEPALNQWRKRINKIAASFEHANKHEAQHEPALQLSGSGASSLAGSSSSSNSKNSSSREAEGHKSQQDADKQRKASHAQASTSNEQSTVSSRSQSPAANTAELQGQMVQALVKDIGGTVSKASSMASNSDDQPMSTEAAASLVSEAVSKASASVTAFMKSSPDADSADGQSAASSSPQDNTSIEDAEATATRIAADAATLAGSMDEGDDRSSKRKELEAVSKRSKSAAKVFKALAHAEKATAAAAHASGALESAVAEARTEGPWFEGISQQSGAEVANKPASYARDAGKAAPAARVH